MSHLKRVQALIGEGKIEEAKAHHNAGVVIASRRASKGQISLKAKLPEFKEAKAALDRAQRRRI